MKNAKPFDALITYEGYMVCRELLIRVRVQCGFGSGVITKDGGKRWVKRVLSTLSPAFKISEYLTNKKINLFEKQKEKTNLKVIKIFLSIHQFGISP